MLKFKDHAYIFKVNVKVKKYKMLVIGEKEKNKYIHKEWK
jgi:hypothetical protein